MANAKYRTIGTHEYELLDINPYYKKISVHFGRTDDGHSHVSVVYTNQVLPDDMETELGFSISEALEDSELLELFEKGALGAAISTYPQERFAIRRIDMSLEVYASSFSETTDLLIQTTLQQPLTYEPFCNRDGFTDILIEDATPYFIAHLRNNEYCIDKNDINKDAKGVHHIDVSTDY